MYSWFELLLYRHSSVTICGILVDLISLDAVLVMSTNKIAFFYIHLNTMFWCPATICGCVWVDSCTLILIACHCSFKWNVCYRARLIKFNWNVECLRELSGTISSLPRYLHYTYTNVFVYVYIYIANFRLIVVRVYIYIYIYIWLRSFLRGDSNHMTFMLISTTPISACILSNVAALLASYEQPLQLLVASYYTVAIWALS